MNTLCFTLLNNLALRLIPAVEPERLVQVYPIDDRGRRENLFSYPDYRALRARATLLSDLVAYIPHGVTIQSASGRGELAEPREAVAFVISANYFALLGAQPARGRTLAAGDDETPGLPAVTVISHRLWQRLGGSEAVLGTPIVVNGQPFIVIGVMPESFVGTLPLAPDLWLPLSMQATVAPRSDRLDAAEEAWLLLIGRLRPGVTRASAELQISAIVRQLQQGRPPEARARGVSLRRAAFFPLDRDPAAVAALVLAATLLLLVAASANVATLLLARALSRQREFAVRLALGSSTARLVRQTLAESAGMVILAGLGALLISSWTLSALYALAIPRLPFDWGRVVLDLDPDWRVFMVTSALCALSVGAVGIAPALQARRVDVREALHGSIAMFGRRVSASRARALLVNTQVAISVALIVLAALLARAAVRAEALELGFSPRGVLMVDYDLRRHQYSDARGAAFTRALAERAASIPGVVSSALASHVALTGGVRATMVWTPDGGREERAQPSRYVIGGGGSFKTLGIPIVRGRDLPPHDRRVPVPEAVVSEVLAQRLWPGLDPIGRRLRTRLADRDYTVVGVVRDTRASSLWRDKETAVYLGPVGDADLFTTRLVVRVEGSADAPIRELQRIANALEPNLAIGVTRLEQSVALWILPSRVAAATGGLIGLLALAFASLGAYGVMRHVLAQQTRDLGIRRALGADTAHLVRFALRQSVPLVLPGLILGALAGHLTGRVISVLLYGLGRGDTLSQAAGVVFVALTAILACYLPARRAAAVHPMTVLRLE